MTGSIATTVRHQNSNHLTCVLSCANQNAKAE